jgi:legumain
MDTKWALLVGGSGDYAAEATVCRLYHTLLDQGGFHSDRIIVMMTDYRAGEPVNPYPGKLFNEPDGPDVRQGCIIDYPKSQVSVQNFLGVLRGDMAAVPKGHRVLESDRDSDVFLYFIDHGSTGFLQVQEQFLYAD